MLKITHSSGKMKFSLNTGSISKSQSLCTWISKYSWVGMGTLTLGLWLTITSTLEMTRCMTIYFYNIVLGYIGKSFKVKITPCPWNILYFQMVALHSLNVEGPCFMFHITYHQLSAKSYLLEHACNGIILVVDTKRDDGMVLELLSSKHLGLNRWNLLVLHFTMFQMLWPSYKPILIKSMLVIDQCEKM